MKTSLSRVATDLLSAEPPAPSAPSAADDARAILAIEAAIHGAARRRRSRSRAFTGFLALAAVFAALAGGRLVLPGSSVHATREVATPAAAASLSARVNALAAGAVVVRGGRESALSDDVPLEARDRIVTVHAGRATITLPTGTHLIVDESSDVTLAEQGPTTAFALAAGSVHADVAKLRPGERFIVRTPDGEVEVWGTSFDVSVVTPSPECGGGTRMRVVVSEGAVLVRSAAGVEDHITKGQSWPRACAAVDASATASAPTNGAPVVGPRPLAPHGRSVQSAASPAATVDAPAAALVRPVPPSLLPAPAAPEPASDLATQNALFAEAAAARRRGDAASAVAAYDRLAARYPSSPLTENAYVERMRVIAASDARRGADAARAYLARYPRGFARTEATDLVASQR